MKGFSYFVLLFVFLFSGCGGDDLNYQNIEFSEVKGKTWQLTNLTFQGKSYNPSIDSARRGSYRLIFPTDTSFSMTTSVNSVLGSYEITNRNSISMNAWLSTLVLQGDEYKGKVDDLYMELTNAAHAYGERNDRLVIESSKGFLFFKVLD